MGELELAGIIVLLSLLLIAVGMPIAFAVFLTGTVGILVLNGMESALYILGTFPISRIGSFSWTALPLFILMGNLAQASGVGSSAYRLATIWLSGLRGSLVLVTISSCGLIGATSGSGATGTIVMGKVAVPEMKKYGYDKKLSVGAVTAAGTVGLLIPPSGSLLIIGILTHLSIGKLFAAGILPGILSVLVYMGMVFTRCMLNPKLAPRDVEVRTSWKEKLFLLVRDGTGILVLFLGVMVPLFTGIATPTETATLGSLIALILWFVAKLRKKSDWAALRESIVDTVKVSAMLFAFVVGAGVFSVFLALAGVVPFLVQFVTDLPIPPVGTLTLIMLCYVPLGMFLDTISVILLTVPVVYPIIVDGLGFNGIWYAILLVKMVELAAITPPIGLSLFVAKGVLPDVSMGDIIRGSFWFMSMDLLTLVILIAFPWITLFLPSLIRF
jgi:tripartite ATP-independent transporter DctM subunit